MATTTKTLGWRDRVARALAGEQRFNLSAYPAFVNDYYTTMGYAGSVYPLQLSAATWKKNEEIAQTLPAYFESPRRSPPAFAAQMVRSSTMGQARMVWQNRRDQHTFRTPALELVERPWINGTTGQLLSRMEWHVGLAGNAYVYRQSATRLRVLRPDWVAIVYGSQSDPGDPKWQLDAEVVGYIYVPGGWRTGKDVQVLPLMPEQVAHWAPLPDPINAGLGMSWLTPGLRDLQADIATTEYKLAFFSNGATPNLVLKNVPAPSRQQFHEWINDFEAGHKSSINAFKTIYLSGGVDATVVGSNLAELQLEAVVAHSETRISYLSRVPAVILGIAAGLKGSSLNAGNYGEARRNFADTWYYGELQDACAALDTIVDTPGGAQLWYDVRNVPLLREDAADAAKIEQTKQQTIVSYIAAGFTPESAVAAVSAQDILVLEHTGLVSVQLQPPGTAMLPGEPGGETPEQELQETPEQETQEQQIQAAAGRSSSAMIVKLPRTRATARELLAEARNGNHDEQPTFVIPDLHMHMHQAPNPPATHEIHIEQPLQIPAPEIRLEQPITVQPAEVQVPVHVETPVTASVQPADVHVEVHPSAPPQVRLEQPINVNTPAITAKPPDVTVYVDAPPTAQTQGVDVEYDDAGRIKTVKPRKRNT